MNLDCHLEGPNPTRTFQESQILSSKETCRALFPQCVWQENSCNTQHPLAALETCTLWGVALGNTAWEIIKSFLSCSESSSPTSRLCLHKPLQIKSTHSGVVLTPSTHTQLLRASLVPDTGSEVRTHWSIRVRRGQLSGKDGEASSVWRSYRRLSVRTLLWTGA